MALVVALFVQAAAVAKMKEQLDQLREELSTKDQLLDKKAKESAEHQQKLTDLRRVCAGLRAPFCYTFGSCCRILFREFLSYGCVSLAKWRVWVPAVPTFRLSLSIKPRSFSRFVVPVLFCPQEMEFFKIDSAFQTWEDGTAANSEAETRANLLTILQTSHKEADIPAITSAKRRSASEFLGSVSQAPVTTNSTDTASFSEGLSGSSPSSSSHENLNANNDRSHASLRRPAANSATVKVSSPVRARHHSVMVGVHDHAETGTARLKTNNGVSVAPTRSDNVASGDAPVREAGAEASRGTRTGAAVPRADHTSVRTAKERGSQDFVSATHSPSAASSASHAPTMANENRSGRELPDHALGREEAVSTVTAVKAQTNRRGVSSLASQSVSVVPVSAAKSEESAGAPSPSHGQTVSGGEPPSQRVTRRTVSMDSTSTVTREEIAARTAAENELEFLGQLFDQERERLNAPITTAVTIPSLRDQFIQTQRHKLALGTRLHDGVQQALASTTARLETLLSSLPQLRHMYERGIQKNEAGKERSLGSSGAHPAPAGSASRDEAEVRRGERDGNAPPTSTREYSCSQLI